MESRLSKRGKVTRTDLCPLQYPFITPSTSDSENLGFHARRLLIEPLASPIAHALGAEAGGKKPSSDPLASKALGQVRFSLPIVQRIQISLYMQ
jgi:hypothetical protein